MTREEAIKTLHELWRETNDSWYEEVYNMAIEALSADTVSREAIMSAKFHPYPFTHITPTDVDAEAYKRGWNDALDAVADNAPTIDAAQGWIPCSERLPKAEDMYQPPEQRYLCQLEAYGERKFCVLSRLKGAVSPFWDWYGIAVHDSDVTAWMPLPKPYKGGDTE